MALKVAESFTRGSGTGGTGTSRNSHSGSQPSAGDHSSSWPAGTWARTAALCRSIPATRAPSSYRSGVGPNSSARPIMSAMSSVYARIPGSTKPWAIARWWVRLASSCCTLQMVSCMLRAHARPSRTLSSTLASGNAARISAWKNAPG